MRPCHVSSRRFSSLTSGFQVKDAREKLGQKDARFKIRGRGGAAGGGVQDARQMINSRKQGQNQFSIPPQTVQQTQPVHFQQSQTYVPQMQMHSNNLASVNNRQFTPNVQGLNVRGGMTPQASGPPKRLMDARDRLSLKRSIGGTQTQLAAAAPFKITKTIQVRMMTMEFPGSVFKEVLVICTLKGRVNFLSKHCLA